VLKCVEIKIYSYFNMSVGLKVGVWRTFATTSRVVPGTTTTSSSATTRVVATTTS